MNRDPATTPELSDAVLNRLPIFPLPRAVLFPGVLMPLHLFEPRYRALAEYCVAGPRLMGLATLEPGYESHYEGRPAIYPVLTVGAIAAERRHPDGRWDIALRGLSRVELVDELPPNEPFRLAKVRRRRELERNDDRVGAENLRSAVVQVANHLPALWPQLSPQLVSAKTPGLLADIVAATFVESSSLRRELLDELVISKRLDRLQDYLAKVLLDLAMRSRSESATSRESLN